MTGWEKARTDYRAALAAGAATADPKPDDLDFVDESGVQWRTGPNITIWLQCDGCGMSIEQDVIGRYCKACVKARLR